MCAFPVVAPPGNPDAMRKLALIVCALVAFAACGGDSTGGGDAENFSDESGFTMSGEVTAAESGVELPDGVVDPEADVGAEADTGGDRSEEGRAHESGTIEVDATEVTGAEDCAEGDTYTVHFTENTAFESDMSDGPDFPDSLVGASVRITGSAHEAEGCTLVAQSVTSHDDGGGAEGGATPGMNQTPSPKPPPGEATPGVGHPAGSPTGNEQ